MIIFLEQSERDRFAAYLEQEAASDEGLASQMAKLIAGSPTRDAVIKRYRAHAMAARIVAQKLRGIETTTT